MTDIIPAILVQNKKEFVQKLRTLPRFILWAQIDVMDGTLTPKTSYADPKLLKKFPHLQFEIHLMVTRPNKHLVPWLKAGAKRIIFHLESEENAQETAKAIRNHGAEALIAINPKTPIAHILPLVPFIDGVVIMGVTPGAQGQSFQKIALQKIAELHKEYPSLPIEVDGGINLATAPLVVKAGANRVVSGSYLFQNSSFESAFELLKNSLS